jgi:hypothetical protein
MKNLGQIIPLALLAASGCLPRDPPAALSIDPGCPAAVAEMVLDAVDQWRVATGGRWAPVVNMGAPGAVPIVCDFHYSRRGRNPLSAGYNDGGDLVVLNLERTDISPDGMYTSVLHELGHFGTEHLGAPGLLMSEQRAPGHHLHCVDLQSARAFCDGAGWECGQSTCMPAPAYTDGDSQWL